jgi:hypothetical protein
MNMLIIGGLLALALVAIVGAVLLGIGDERAEKQQEAEKAAHLLQAPEASQASDAALPTARPEMGLSGDLRITRELAPSLHENEYHPAYQSGQLSAPVSSDEDSIAILMSQFHAITGELRSLGQKASELEQHLNMLSEVFESLGHPQDDVTTKIPVTRFRGTE